MKGLVLPHEKQGGASHQAKLPNEALSFSRISPSASVSLCPQGSAMSWPPAPLEGRDLIVPRSLSLARPRPTAGGRDSRRKRLGGPPLGEAAKLHSSFQGASRQITRRRRRRQLAASRPNGRRHGTCFGHCRRVERREGICTQFWRHRRTKTQCKTLQHTAPPSGSCAAGEEGVLSSPLLRC